MDLFEIIMESLVGSRSVKKRVLFRTLREPKKINRHYSEIIDFFRFPSEQDPQFFLDEYLKNGLSTSKIAQKIGRSRTYVMDRLKHYGIETSPKNRPNKTHTPYGYKWINGSIVPHQGEQKIIKQINELNRREFNYAQIAEILNAQGHRSKGNVPWQRWSVRKVFERQKAKNAA